MRLVEIRLSELGEFVKSKEFEKLHDKPISTNRVQSYLNNPRSKPDDLVLIYAFEGNQLLAFRTLLPDWFKVNNKQVRFAWLSGNWVNPNYRRKGYSSLLFKTAYESWNGKLAYSNYAPESKMVYDKTGQFELLQSLKGRRFYRRYSLHSLLVNRNRFFKSIEPCLKKLDSIGNSINDYRLKLLTPKENPINLLPELEQHHFDLMEKVREQNFYSRGAKEFQWIDKYSWISTKKTAQIESGQYYFSTFSPDWETGYLETKKEGTLNGLIRFNLKQSSLKIPYVYLHDNSELESLVQNLSWFMASRKVDYLTVYDSRLISKLQSTNQFWASKRFTQNFLATKKLNHCLPSRPILQSGDGDGVFI